MVQWTENIPLASGCKTAQMWENNEGEPSSVFRLKLERSYCAHMYCRQ